MQTLTIGEVAQFSGMKQKTIANAVYRGYLKQVSGDARVFVDSSRFTLEEINRWLLAGRHRYTDRSTIDALHPFVHTIPESGCWVWTAGISHRGYGLYRGKRAHRVAWEQANGPIPDGMVLDHVCRVRCCVNPNHLRVVSVSENVTTNSESPSALNKRKTGCPRCGTQYDVITERKRSCRRCVNRRAAESRKRRLGGR